MCGIAGLCHFKNPGENMERMKQRMIHRGPDAGGTWLSEDGAVCLGHRRLSIVDLTEAGAQPMQSHSGRYVCVFNGEIYNHRTLREKLLKEKKVTAFRGTSDTEVLLEAFEAYGVEETIRRCKGMFAIALFDKETKTITLLRDRIGEKPLYYGFVAGAFVFASDLGCITVLEGFDNPIFTDVLDIYFAHGYIPAPYTIYQKIWKLEPGKMLTIGAPYAEGTQQTKAYWSLREKAKYGQSHLFTGTREEAADELERLLRASIRDQMVADVPVGAFLSAGIDSSTVVALMQQESERKVRSFTIGMEDPKYNEAVYAGEIAKHLGTEHTELYITEKDAREVIPMLPAMFAEPFADSSQIPTYLVSKMTREHVTVSLSGDAGDELFCGYTSYAGAERMWNMVRRIPGGIRKPAAGLLLYSPLRNNIIWRSRGIRLASDSPEDIYRVSYETDPLIGRIALKHKQIPYAYTQLGPDETGEVNHDIMLMDMSMYHPDDILVKVDRTAMAVSLETRVPLLDKDVVEFAWTLPIDYLRADGVGKLVLRDVLYRYVPREMMERPKKGFSIPVDQWLRKTELRDWAEGLIERRKLTEQGILDPDVVWEIWNRFIGTGEWCVQVWYILMFQAWMETEYKGGKA